MGVQVRYLVVRPGIYNLAKEIKYRIEGGKGHEVRVIHSEYEQLYLKVVGKGGNQDNKIDFADAFKEFAVEDHSQTQVTERTEE